MTLFSLECFPIIIIIIFISYSWYIGRTIAHMLTFYPDKML